MDRQLSDIHEIRAVHEVNFPADARAQGAQDDLGRESNQNSAEATEVDIHASTTIEFFVDDPDCEHDIDQRGNESPQVFRTHVQYYCRPGR